jgi:hypothetical protein
VTAPLLAGLDLAEEPEAWERIGFALEGDACRIGAIVVRLHGAGAGDGLFAWTLAGDGAGEIDGLPTSWVGAPQEHAQGARHPNGAIGIDHVVVSTPDLERTFAALAHAGLELRRVRDTGTPERPLRQGFYRIGEALLEVVGPAQPDGDGPAVFWGLVAVVADLDACAELLADDLGTVRDAVQAGRRIATVRRTSGISVPLALMSSVGPP